MKLFCKHEWKILEHTVIKSEYQRIVELGFAPSGLRDATEKHIILVTCSKCGKFKKIIEEN